MQNELEPMGTGKPATATLNRVFIGFDQRQAISFTVAATSVISSTETPLAISPLVYQALPLTRKGLTPFTWTRFLVPWLCNYQGWAAFLDADVMLRGDINDLFSLADEKYAVMVSEACVGNLAFERAAVMLFNCAHPDNRKLTPEFVNTENKLHSIGWTESIGFFPGTWNHLVGYMPEDPHAKLVHFTQGVPCWPETVNTEHAKEWHNLAKVAFSAQPWESLMGHSVHAKPVMERLAREKGLNGAFETQPDNAVPGVM